MERSRQFRVSPCLASARWYGQHARTVNRCDRLTSARQPPHHPSADQLLIGILSVSLDGIIALSVAASAVERQCSRETARRNIRTSTIWKVSVFLEVVSSWHRIPASRGVRRQSSGTDSWPTWLILTCWFVDITRRCRLLLPSVGPRRRRPWQCLCRRRQQEAWPTRWTIANSFDVNCWPGPRRYPSLSVSRTIRYDGIRKVSKSRVLCNGARLAKTPQQRAMVFVMLQISTFSVGAWMCVVTRYCFAVLLCTLFHTAGLL